MAKSKSETTTTRMTVIRGSVRLNKADKEIYNKIKSDLAESCGFTPTPQQTVEYMLRQYIKNY